jgi:pyruvate,water dikinase
VLSYALERGIDLSTVELAVVVQKTVRLRSSGVMFTIDPISGDRLRIVLEASGGSAWPSSAARATPTVTW